MTKVEIVLPKVDVTKSVMNNCYVDGSQRIYKCDNILYAIFYNNN